MINDCLCWPWLPGWGNIPGLSSVQLLLSPSSFHTGKRSGRKSLCATYDPLPWWLNLHKSLRILLHRRFFSSLSFMYVCIYLQKNLLVWTHDMYFALWITIQYYPNLFSCSNIFSIDHLVFFQLVFMPFWCASISVGIFWSTFENFVTFWHYKMLQVRLIICRPNPRISHLSKELWK